MATSDDGHQLNESNNPLSQIRFTAAYLRSTLDRPPFGLIMQLSPRSVWFAYKRSLWSSIDSLLLSDPDTLYPVYTPIVGMSGHYHLVCNSLVELITDEETLDSELNNLASDSDPTYEENLELQERIGRVDSRLSEETIMQHIEIKCYHNTTSTKEEPDICVICQGEFEYDEFMGGLRCGHEYHLQCIKKWLQQINNCPICKATAVS